MLIFIDHSIGSFSLALKKVRDDLSGTFDFTTLQLSTEDSLLAIFSWEMSLFFDNFQEKFESTHENGSYKSHVFFD